MRNLYKSIFIMPLVLLGEGVMVANALAEPAYLEAIEPCRIFDTRSAAFYLPGRFYGNGETRDYHVWGGGELIQEQGGSFNCEIPGDATSVQINFTAVNPSGFGYLRAWPNGGNQPNATLLTWDGSSISNSVILKINNDGWYDISVKVFGSSTDLIGDITGYFVPF